MRTCQHFIFTKVLAENEQLLRVAFRDCGDMQTISENILGSDFVTALGKASIAIEAIMIGSALLLIDGLAEGLSMGTL